MKNFSTPNTSLNYTYSNQELIAEGVVFNQWKKLTFKPNAKVEVKIRNKHTQGVLIRLTQKNAIVSYGDNKVKIVSHEDLIKANYARIETCIRIEKNGVGPYNYCGEASPAYVEWKDNQGQAMYIRRAYGLAEHQPSPAVDPYLNCYQHEVSNFIFAFQDYTQLFNWFSLSDIQLLVKEGFEIKVYQQGLDYVESIYSPHQLALITDESIRVLPARSA